ncbi:MULTISPECIES: hypothetical protein [Prochlorococcus]|uniref:hypothetical protein n=1 Tax=Prochlorococcus TaxID=1218 RepID=UPI0007B31CBD|nr:MULTISPECIES: hypothetical protein [Prochlorococcus]KZR65855.1 hypothetical protein PMIT1312_01119 [Prochlorococcus marinus str. MIT 1312]KZR82144.1 hypothetical protein PMIT1327_00917 [Prochlorococcus marinus str. MIT 1327]NMO85069.1 hypothetical protein [Prochlorococcus sp. P1344]NMP06600.1 hypothetical protein [Prochlorococcus sp. P1361]NMP13542.1 hypothetical protein [Prochlorococcus sp.P1363]
MAKAPEEKTSKAPEEKITTDTIILLLIRITFIVFDSFKRLVSLLNAGVTKDTQTNGNQIVPAKESNDKLKGLLKKELVDLVIAYEKETGIDHQSVK